MEPPTHLVIDASFAVRALLPLSSEEHEIELIARARGEGTELLAPDLWTSEVVSAIRRLVFLKAISPVEADRALTQLFTLGIQTVPTELALARQAFRWAERLGQSKAYDALYLALADRLETTLWTADHRLAERAHQIGAEWVKFTGKVS